MIQKLTEISIFLQTWLNFIQKTVLFEFYSQKFCSLALEDQKEDTDQAGDEGGGGRGDFRTARLVLGRRLGGGRGRGGGGRCGCRRCRVILNINNNKG